MKRIFIILTALLLLTQLNYSQPQVFVDDGNSSTTTLSANGTFTGTYRLIGDYSSILVQVRSNRSSATNGVRVEFANGSISKTMYFDKKSMWTYTANDSTTNFICPVLGAYYRVKYVNGTDSQTTFRLYTTLLKNPINNLSNADSILANLKESNQLLQTQINTLNAKMDTVKNQNVRLLSDLRTLKLNTDSLHFFITYKDSLVGADTTLFDFGNKALFGEINIYNSTAHADSQVVEYWDMFNNRWTNQLTSLKENLTQLPIALDASNLATVIIGAGISKRYIINEPYPGKVRVRTRYTTGQGTDKIYVGFIGKN